MLAVKGGGYVGWRLLDMVLQNISKAEALSYIAQEKERLYTRLKNGDTETEIQTGAGAYSDKEWARLLQRFDAAIQREDEEEENAESQARETTTAIYEKLSLQAEALKQKVTQSSNPKDIEKTISMW